MANWIVRRMLHPKNFNRDLPRQFLTLNELYDDPSIDFIDEKVHPIFYKGLGPIHVNYQEEYRKPIFYNYGMCGFYCIYNQEGELSQDQFGFNPPIGSPHPGSPIPEAVDWKPDNENEFMPYLGVEDKQPITSLDGYPSSYLGKVIETNTGTVLFSYPPSLPFLQYTGYYDSGPPNIAILKASGYGSVDNSPNTEYSGPAVGVKPEWTIMRVDSSDDVDLATFSQTLADKLNDDGADFGGLHPLQMKMPIFVSGSHQNHYTAVVFYTKSYAEAAPNTFVVNDQHDPYHNKIILPYSASYRNANGEAFSRWCWIQQSRLIHHSDGGRDHAFQGEKALIGALERLPPAQQFLAQVSCTQNYEPLLFYLNYPLAYYEGYKKVTSDDLSAAAATNSDQKYIFLNLSGEDIDVYVLSGDSGLDDQQVGEDAICIRNTYLTKGYHQGANNLKFKVTKKGDANTILGYYQAVDVPDLHDYHVTIIVEPKSD